MNEGRPFGGDETWFSTNKRGVCASFRQMTLVSVLCSLFSVLCSLYVKSLGTRNFLNPLILNVIISDAIMRTISYFQRILISMDWKEHFRVRKNSR
jgi:hypothetical protein